MEPVPQNECIREPDNIKKTRIQTKRKQRIASLTVSRLMLTVQANAIGTPSPKDEEERS